MEFSLKKTATYSNSKLVFPLRVQNEINIFWFLKTKVDSIIGDSKIQM